MPQKKTIYINLIVKDLARATAFYEAIGFVQNPLFSNEVASAMAWSDEIIFMLLTKDFARNFNDGKDFVDQKKTVSAFYAFGLASKDDVDTFCQKAVAAGGRVYPNAFNQAMASDFMYTFEVEDTEGYILEPSFMDISKFSPA
jgi:uncharacterized protein